jgi:hypothetical protein
VFSIFATLSVIDFKMFGIGMATAVLIDATIIRGILLPAAMTLLGEHNWYLPRQLAWLPGPARPSRDGRPINEILKPMVALRGQPDLQIDRAAGLAARSGYVQGVQGGVHGRASGSGRLG